MISLILSKEKQAIEKTISLFVTCVQKLLRKNLDNLENFDEYRPIQYMPNLDVINR